MDPSFAAEIAKRFAPSLSWRTMRGLLRTHIVVLRTAGVLIGSGPGMFSLGRQFEAWEPEGEGIRVVFIKDENKKVLMLTGLVRREGTTLHAVAFIDEPGPLECLVAVLTGVPPDRKKLKIRLLDGIRRGFSLFFSFPIFDSAEWLNFSVA